MVNVKGYISSNFTKSFLTIFLPFFIIISLVFLVRIAALTSQIQISFGELILLYSYSIPEIIFYTLPLSFISALANLLVKLSQDNELIALYALGLKSKKILSSLVILGLLFTLLLASISILAMPLSKQFYKSFKEEKQNDAKLNIVPGKLGQKFGNYYIYVKEKKEEKFHDIVIYNRTNKASEQFFSSQTGQLNQHQNITSLLLNEGYGYTYSEVKLQQAQYKTLEIFDSAQKKGFVFMDVEKYWSRLKNDIKYMKKILFFTFVSFIPLLSVYLVAAFTMINPRYQNNHSFIVTFVTTLSLYLIASSLQKWGTPLTLIIAIISVAVLGRWLFNTRVAKYF
ncbi:MAG: YjgP/YjgQ family permease [Epsilonproteobacteria bacterium]|nr:MAG: YjgP/YjgQ family permease [Campylobacterota bacterium]